MRYLITLFFLFITILSCAEESIPQNMVITLPANEIHNGNYFVMGSSVEISGTVNGDVYALAEQVIIDGVVNGDVLACVGSIDISGKVLRNCRIIGGQVLIGGTIGNNVTAIGGSVQLLPFAKINGNLVAVSGNAEIASFIGSDVTLIASNARVSSTIKKDLEGYVGSMRITSKAVIDGNVEYQSSTPAWIESGATIRGTVTYRPSFVHQLVKGTWIQGLLVGSKVVVILMNFLYTVVIGIIVFKLFPHNLEAALHSLKIHPLKSLSYGIVLLVLLPLTSLILLMTILGVPFALTLIALNIIGFYTAKVYSIFWASQSLLKWLKLRRRILCFLFAAVLYFFLTAIPILGPIIAFASMLFGLGAGVLAQTKHGVLSLPKGR